MRQHTLPQNRLESLYGSDKNASCSSKNNIGIGERISYDGTSALNDGHIPALDGVSSNLTSLWATELFTMRRPTPTARIILSFEVDSDNHDRMELAVFNCPEMGISLPMVDVYFDSSFRPDRSGSELGNLNLIATTTDGHLL